MGIDTEKSTFVTGFERLLHVHFASTIVGIFISIVAGEFMGQTSLSHALCFPDHNTMESCNCWEVLYADAAEGVEGTFSCAFSCVDADKLAPQRTHKTQNRTKSMNEISERLEGISRERKSNTNFSFLKLFGHLRDIPAKSRDIPAKKFGFPGFEGHTELFGPHPFKWKTPTQTENIRTQKFGFGFFFRA